jgi:hypothetical protein
MIEETSSTERLLDRLRTALPFSAYVKKQALSAGDSSGHRVVRNEQKLLIEDVLDGGDIAGILCMASLNGGKEALAISITHLRFELSNPLYKQIRAYQIQRIKGLAAARIAQDRRH